MFTVDVTVGHAEPTACRALRQPLETLGDSLIGCADDDDRGLPFVMRTSSSSVRATYHDASVEIGPYLVPVGARPEAAPRDVNLGRATGYCRFVALGARTIRTNADCSGRILEEIATPDAEGVALLRQAADALHLSARGFHRTLRVASTLADLDGIEKVGRIHIAEALSYRGETLRRAHAA